MNAARDFFHLLGQAPRGQLLALALLLLAGALTEGIGLLLLVPLLDLLAGGDSAQGLARRLPELLALLGVQPGAGGLLSAFVALVALRSAVQHAGDLLGTGLRHRLVDRLRLRCFAALLGVEWRWLVGTRRADHANLLLTDVARVGTGLHFGLGLLVSLVTMGAYLAAALALSWRLTLVALASAAVVFALLYRQRRGALQLGQALTQAGRALQGNVQESLAGIKLAKILGSEPRHLDAFARSTDQLRDQQLRFAAGTSLSRALFQLGGAALLAGFLYVGLTLWHMALAELLTLVLIFSRLIPQAMNAQQQLHHWLHALPALQQTEALLRECAAQAEPAPAADAAPIRLQDAVCLEGVSLRYGEREQPALDGVTLRLPVRSTTAVMGASGAGKSTLADLLMGLLQPDSGRLAVDGLPITGPARRAWRRQVAYVPQEVFLFDDSIRNNLLWARPEASAEALQQALASAAADFVFALPQGLDTRVGDGGVLLSGGERQRIALARALLQRPSLLILDEATSALDTANEARIRQALLRLRGELTVLIIGHRLATLEHADQVVVLEQGRIAAQGSWAEVRARVSVPPGP